MLGQRGANKVCCRDCFWHPGTHHVTRSPAAMISTLQGKSGYIYLPSMGENCNYFNNLIVKKLGEMELYTSGMSFVVFKIHGGIQPIKCGWIRFPFPHFITHRLCLTSPITRFWFPLCLIHSHKRQIGFVLGRQRVSFTGLMLINIRFCVDTQDGVIFNTSIWYDDINKTYMMWRNVTTLFRLLHN